MNLLIDINHPCHVHLFKNFYFQVSSNSNVIITTKAISSITDLLKDFNIPYILIGKKYDNLYRKIFSQIVFDYKLNRIAKRNNVSLAIGVSVNITQTSYFSSFQSIMFDDDDDDVIPFSRKYAHPFANCLISPDVLKGKRKMKKTIFYPGYHELAYLHPNRFIPNKSEISELGLNSNEKYFVLRFNVFKAHHDKGAQGITLKNKVQLVDKLSKKGKVFITSERKIEPELEKYQLKISPGKIHHLLAFATMFIGDSQTMTSEAAVLGTPAIRSNSFVGKISYLEELEKRYGLAYGFLPDHIDQMFKKIDELLSIPNLKDEWQRRRKKMLQDKIDVTAFMVWFVENYPNSADVMKDNPDYALRFK